MSNVFHKDFVDDDNHALTAITYADITARDADTDFQVTANINKMVRVDSPASYFLLVSLDPTVWTESGSEGLNEWTELLDTENTISPNLVVQGNAAGTALKFGQDLTTTGTPIFEALFVDQLIINNTGTGSNPILDSNSATETLKLFGGLEVTDNLTAENQVVVGGSGDPETDSSIDLKATDEALLLNRLTTTQRDAINAIAGMTIYNTTLNDHEFFNGTVWQSSSGGDVVGPASSVVDSVSTFSATGGKNIQDPNAMFISGGNVGIGFTNLSAKLNINFEGDGVQGLKLAMDNPFNFEQEGTGSTSILQLKPEFENSPFAIVAADNSNVAFFNTKTSGTSEIILLEDGGNVGIGTSAPSAALQVGTKTTSSGNNGSDTSVFFGSVDFSAGAGSVAPLAIFDDDTTFAAGTGGGIIFGGTYADDNSEVGAGIQGIRESSVGFADDWGLAFYTSFDNNILNEVVRIDKDGNLGIGTTAPTELLEVAGTIKATQLNTDVLNTDVLNKNTVYFTSEADLPTPVSGVITLQENTTYVMYNDDPTASQKQVTLTNKLQIPDAGGCRITSVGLATALLVYTGTGTFITTSDTFTGFLSIDELFMSAPNGTLFDIDGVLPVGSEFFPRIFLNSMGVFDTDTIGTIKTISVNFNIGAFFDCSQGLVLDGVDEFLIGDWRFANWKNTVDAVMITAKNSLRFPKIQNCTLETNINEAAFNIFPSIGDETFVIGGNSYRGEGELYATGVSGTITAVSNVTGGESGTITAVSGTPFGEVVMLDSFTTVVEGQIITTTGFTDPAYNGTFEVLEVTTNTFRIHALFTTTGTGTWTSNEIQFTAVNSLAVGDGVQVTGTDNYDAGYRVLGIGTDTFSVNGTFVVTETGSFNTDSLTETDPRMRVVANAGMADSKIIGFGEMNNNTNLTTIAQGIYGSIDVTGTVENAVTQRFVLTNASIGEFTYIGQEDLAGQLNAVVSATKTGSTANYRFTVSINGGSVNFAADSFAPMEVKTTKVSITVLQPVNIVTGDTVQIMAAGDGTGDNITITDLSMEIKGD